MRRCCSSSPDPSSGGLLSHRIGGLDALRRSSLRWAAVKLAAPSPTVAARLPLSMSVHPAILAVFKNAGGISAASIEEAFLNRQPTSGDDGDALQQKRGESTKHSLGAEMSMKM